MVQLPEIEYLINNYFPNLKNVTINTTWHKEKDSFAYITGNRYKGFNIAFSKKDYTRLKRKVILGVLSHELAHIEYDLRYNFFVTLIKTFLFKFNTRYETKVEREVDMIAIKNGCGKYLYSFYKYHNKRYEKYTKKDGLTKQEVKSLIS